MRSFIICTLHKILLRLEVKEDAMDRACNTHRRAEKFVQNFSRET
jgi:hypothetical protein